MEKSGSRSVCEAQREGFWVGGSSLISPIVLHTPHTKTLSLLFPSIITDHILEKMVISNRFQTNLTKTFDCGTHFKLHTTCLENIVGAKSFFKEKILEDKPMRMVAVIFGGLMIRPCQSQGSFTDAFSRNLKIVNLKTFPNHERIYTSR